MKHCLKTALFSALFALLAVGQVLAQDSSRAKVIIEGNLTGVKDGTHISLMQEQGSVGSEVAKDSLQNGHFHIEYTPEDTALGIYSLMSFDDNFPSMALKFWAKPGHPIYVQGENNLVYTWVVTSDIPEQQEWAYFINANKNDWDDYQKLSIIRKARMATLIDFKSSDTAKKSARTAVDSLDKESEVIEYKIQKHNLALLQQVKMTPTRLQVLNDVANQIKWYQKEDLRAPVTTIYKTLSQELKNSEYGQKLTITLYAPRIIAPGEEMYDTDLFDLAGNTHHLADFKGQYLLVDFWSFGCGPCHASVPELKEIAEKLKGKLTVVSLSSDTKKIWKKATDYFKLTGNNFSDLKEDRGIYAHYGVAGIPHYVLISPDGIVKSAWTGYGTGSISAPGMVQI